MSINAKIRDTERNGHSLTLFLEPRWDERVDRFSIVGQPMLRIEHVTWEPQPGMIVWGGSGEVVIGWGVDEHHYDRIMTMTLREKWRDPA